MSVARGKADRQVAPDIDAALEQLGFEAQFYEYEAETWPVTTGPLAGWTRSNTTLDGSPGHHVHTFATEQDTAAWLASGTGRAAAELGEVDRGSRRQARLAEGVKTSRLDALQDREHPADRPSRPGFST